ncbi:MAG: hypothetical protein Q4A28_04390 [Brachymonas sp.]|nr:hypothetical protein [Brachymonas sp.]
MALNSHQTPQASGFRGFLLSVAAVCWVGDRDWISYWLQGGAVGDLFMGALAEM